MTEKYHQVVLVDDDMEMRAAVAQWFELAGYLVHCFANAPAALAHLSRGGEGVVVSDLRMPQMDGMTFLSQVNALDAEIPVVLITAHGDVEMAVEAMRRGAYDFIEKPFDPERLLDAVSRACEKYCLVKENRELRQRLTGAPAIDQSLVGNSPVIRRLREEILNLADTDAAVLIQGETGTGKEIVARCLHRFGSRRDRRFVAVNCAAVPESVFESELFGHERGAFTGAEQQRVGRFEYAHQGVLFLDEIGSMPPALQSKVLRTLQEREILRIGSNEPQPLDIRLICATNTNLRDACRAGQFREDLYYRINVVELTVPPLRERDDDILLLFDYFVGQAAAAYKRPALAISSSDAGRLLRHDWPGNVRELKNIAERYVLSAVPRERRLLSVLAGSQAPDDAPAVKISLQEMLRMYERMLLEHALIRHQGDVQAVMDELDLPRRTLNEKMARHQLDRKTYL
jgi:two-component system C4-dicarboxylate transport response regulator DctD